MNGYIENLESDYNTAKSFCESNGLTLDDIIPSAQCYILNSDGVIEIQKIEKYNGGWHFVKRVN